MEKTFISANQLLEDSYRLAAKVLADGFRPQCIVGIWRGGAPVAIAVQEFFDFKKVTTDHIAVRTSAYFGIGQQAREIEVHGLEYLIQNIRSADSLLIVDDVFDTGRSVEALLQQLSQRTGLNMPAEVRIACPYFKPDRNMTHMMPNYYVQTTDKWLVFPHELSGLTDQEIRKGKPELASIFDLLL